jgi:hypothetical protein
LKISSDAGLINIDITDQRELDSLTGALRASSQTHANLGGVFEIWADADIYKGKKFVRLRVLFSKYNGWYIEIDNRTWRCEYLFDLVKRYSGKQF